MNGIQVAPTITCTDKLTNQNFLQIDYLPYGSYVLVSSGIKWAPNDVRDFTVRIYGNSSTKIV